MPEIQEVMKVFRTNVGPGADEKHTKDFRKWYPDIIEKYSIKSVNDAGCGFCWIKDLADIEYHGYDIIERECGKILDITKEPMPSADLVVCRDVFNHFTENKILDALRLFKKSHKYIMTASCHSDNKKIPKGEINRLIQNGGVNLFLDPYSLPDPIEKMEEPLSRRVFCLWESEWIFLKS